MPRLGDFSESSRKRLEAGHSLRILDSKVELDLEIVSSIDLPSIDHFVDSHYLDTFNDLLELLESENIEVRRNPNLVRGLDYYNGTCFELKLATDSAILGQSQNTLLAGGRYDYLAAVLAGDKKRTRLPAIGWAAGIDRLCILLEDLESSRRLDTEQSQLAVAGLGIVSIVDKVEDSWENARVIRKASHALRRHLQEGTAETIELDLREGLKLGERLAPLLDQRQAVITLGFTEA